MFQFNSNAQTRTLSSKSTWPSPFTVASTSTGPNHPTAARDSTGKNLSPGSFPCRPSRAARSTTATANSPTLSPCNTTKFSWPRATDAIKSTANMTSDCSTSRPARSVSRVPRWAISRWLPCRRTSRLTSRIWRGMRCSRPCWGTRCCSPSRSRTVVRMELLRKNVTRSASSPMRGCSWPTKPGGYC